jgi:hypothetical protein
VNNFETDLFHLRKKRLKKSQLNSHQVQEIVDGVNRQCLTHDEVASKHGISRLLVQRLVKGFSRDPDFIKNIGCKEVKCQDLL